MNQSQSEEVNNETLQLDTNSWKTIASTVSYSVIAKLSIQRRSLEECIIDSLAKFKEREAMKMIVCQIIGCLLAKKVFVGFVIKLEHKLFCQTNTKIYTVEDLVLFP